MQVDRIDPAFGHWFAGFADGEGSFAIARRTRKHWIGYCCAFTIALRDDDQAVLELVHRTIGIGTMSWKPAAQVGNNGQPQARWTVGGKRDCLLLVAIFDRFPLRSKKAADCVIWREAVMEWQRMRSGSKPGNDWSYMAQLRDALMSGRQYQALTPQLPAAAVKPALF